ncbi:MAG: HoxN/HupN/NixA family nickel/cobalt transporter [Hyphomicrobiales bacterium]|nr:HoxN/HupN/NixA family nickel/cobalt transporter [Hyphomicrobiales bacterium]MBV8824115.1 HoxN/HupN/NixA family nickel/cobalt transporter [Hyphomicrobiales bacterium]MBV9428363.1 HoxN/HupN/NixA family nickel/cobalt transporter [Bradyrhizobiaceae bacterium]
MSNFVSGLLSDGADDVRPRVRGLGLVLIVANVTAWLWALTAFAGQPVLLGTAALAYSLGLRHGLDPDHIAAIDNVTRRLMQEGKRPVAAGFFFALGHSSVVLVASAAVALAAGAFADQVAGLREVGSIVGTSASALFLFAIAAANIVVLRGVYQAFRRAQAGRDIREEDLAMLLAQRGWLARLFRPLFRLVSRSWHLFPIGVVFALGFDTASAISLFGLSVQASHEASAWSVLVFPALFAAGMTLIDTADGILMLGAYGWAFVKPARKLFYNFAITLVSVVVALVIGGIEVLGLVADRLDSERAFWRIVTEINANFASLGYAIVAIFAAGWLGSMLLYRLRGEDRAPAPSAAMNSE